MSQPAEGILEAGSKAKLVAGTASQAFLLLLYGDPT
jgi:hypothetical protein